MPVVARLNNNTNQEQWQSFAIADSPVALTHDQKAVLDLTGTTAIAPLVVNVSMPALSATQAGEITLSDVVGASTWGTGFLKLQLTDGATNPIITTVPNANDPTQNVVANDGIVDIDQQEIGGLDMVIRYLKNTGQADIRVIVPNEARDVFEGSTQPSADIYSIWVDTSTDPPASKVYSTATDAWL